MSPGIHFSIIFSLISDNACDGVHAPTIFNFLQLPLPPTEISLSPTISTFLQPSLRLTALSLSHFGWNAWLHQQRILPYTGLDVNICDSPQRQLWKQGLNVDLFYRISRLHKISTPIFSTNRKWIPSEYKYTHFVPLIFRTSNWIFINANEI